MIDDSDGTFALVVFGGPVGLVLAIILWIIAAQNEQECSEMKCPNGGGERLLDHDCLCVEKAR